MTRPGTNILTRETPPARTAPTDTGVWFVTGVTEQGPSTPVLIRSLDHFERYFGERVSYSVLYDAIETYFREGGAKVYVSRVLGPAPVSATANLHDAAGSLAGDVSLVATAVSAGDWANALDVEIEVDGTDFEVIVSHDDDGEVDRSGLLADRAAAVTWAESSDWIRLTLGPSAEDPRVQGPTSLATGTDDHTNIVEAQWKAALDRFVKDLGPGQVSAPGHTTAQGQTDLLDHASEKNRIAIVDAPDTTSESTLKAAAAALDSLTNARYGGLFAPWVVIPGLVPSTTRSVPPSGLVAGLIARSDATNSPNVAAAGDNGQSVFCVDVEAEFDDLDREELNEAAVDLIRVIFGGVVLYGFRTLVDPEETPAWVELTNARLFMAVRARADIIANHHVFAQIDGRGIEFAKFGGELTGMLLPYYESGSLYGLTPEEAFQVNVGPDVNTEETIANREIRAVISLRVSHFGELVTIEVVKVPTEQSL